MEKLDLILLSALIDTADDLIHEKCYNATTGMFGLSQPEGLDEVFDDLVNAHNDMLGVFCSFSELSDRLDNEIRQELRKFVSEWYERNGK